MTKSSFDIEEASDGHEPEEQYGGEINLEDLKPIGGQSWVVGTPDPKDPRRPIDGGTVGNIQIRAPHVIGPPANRAVNQGGVLWEIKQQLVQSIPTVVQVVTVFLGFGFVLVVNNDVARNNLDLTTYVKSIGYAVGGLLTALGLIKGYGSLTRRQGDGSG